MAWSAARIRWLWVLSVALLLAIAAAASWAEAQRAAETSQPLLVPLVGLLLGAAAAAMRGPAVPRVLLGTTAVFWLLGSLSQWLLVTHQCVLLLVLLAVPGWLHGWNWLVAGVTPPIAVGMLAQPLIGAVFLVAGAGILLRRRTPSSVGAAVAGALIGATLVVSWWVSRVDPAAFDPYAAVLVYEGALVAAASALALGSRAETAHDGELVDRLVAGAEPAGLLGLGGVLAEVLRAPGLRILRPPPDRHLADDLPVTVGDSVVAVIRHPAVETLDAAAMARIAEAVRLVVLGEDQRALVDEHLLALRAAQRRLELAEDEQRATTAAKLRDEVVAPLRRAATALEGAVDLADPVARDAVGVGKAQILDATADLEELVRGAGPRGLGRGRLVEAIRELAQRSPVPVDVRVEGAVSASEAVERTLFYVCAEALVNVHRHAEASSAAVLLARAAGGGRLTVADDGVGGADPSRSGLTGLADRAALHGGRLRVDSPPGAGTVVTVDLPSTGG